MKFCRDGTRNRAYRSEQGTAPRKGRRAATASSTTGNSRRVERPKERGLAGGAKGSSAASFHDTASFEILSTGSGAALLRRVGLRPPLGGVRRIRGAFFPALIFHFENVIIAITTTLLE